jgi:hypothetical protein
MRTSQSVYFLNADTGQSQWLRPAGWEEDGIDAVGALP